jgi:hypothetical protein
MVAGPVLYDVLQETMPKHANRLLARLIPRVTLPLLMVVVSTSCKDRAAHSGVDSKIDAQGAAVRANQVNLWYQTLAAMKREGYESAESYEEAVNLAIVENYFPLYLQQLREGAANDSHLRLAASAYSLLSEKTRSELPLAKTMSDDSLQRISDTGVLSSFGYVEEDYSSGKKFNSLRRAYLDTLESKRQNKSEMATPRKSSD